MSREFCHVCDQLNWVSKYEFLLAMSIWVVDGFNMFINWILRKIVNYLITSIIGWSLNSILLYLGTTTVGLELVHLDYVLNFWSNKMTVQRAPFAFHISQRSRLGRFDSLVIVTWSATVRCVWSARSRCQNLKGSYGQHLSSDLLGW